MQCKAKGGEEMKYRKGIGINDATERELLRWQMERIVKESSEDSLGESSEALAKLNDSLQNSYARAFLLFAMCLYSVIGFFVFVIKFLRRE